MDERSSQPGPGETALPGADPGLEAPDEPEPATSGTGVASGSLGTGTALDETQVYRNEDLVEVAGPALARGDESSDRAGTGVGAGAADPVRGAAAPAVLAAQPPRSRSNPVVGVAAVVGAAALVVLAASVLLGNHDNGNIGAGQTQATFSFPADGTVPSPSDRPGDSGRGNGIGNGERTHKP